jgi:hypothetical protein
MRTHYGCWREMSRAIILRTHELFDHHRKCANYYAEHRRSELLLAPLVSIPIGKGERLACIIKKPRSWRVRSGRVLCLGRQLLIHFAVDT